MKMSCDVNIYLILGINFVVFKFISLPSENEFGGMNYDGLYVEGN
jgi:hypothetical protein